MKMTGMHWKIGRLHNRVEKAAVLLLAAAKYEKKVNSFSETNV